MRVQNYLVLCCVLCASCVECTPVSNEIEDFAKMKHLNKKPPSSSSSTSSIMPVPKTLPVAPSSSEPPYRIRSALRNFYFTYRFYEPEMQFARCVLKFAGTREFKIIDRVTDTVGQNATEYMRAMFDRLGSSVGRFMDTLVCDGSSASDKQHCKEISRRQDKSGSNENSSGVGDDGAMDVFRVIIMNATEKWLRSVRMLQPIMESISSMDMRLVGHYLTGAIDRNFEKFSELLMPGLFVCTKNYMNEIVWRTFESWL